MSVYEDESSRFGIVLDSSIDYGDLRNGTMLDNRAIPDDAKWALMINRRITWYGIAPMSVIGVGLSIVLIVVWSQKRKFRPIIFYFKSLGFLDSFYIIMFNLWWYSPVSTDYAFVVRGFAFGSQYMAVNVSLLLTVCHWLSLNRPYDWVKWFSPYRTKLSVCIVIVYCAVVKFIERVVKWNFNEHSFLNTAINVVAAQIMMTVPPVLEAVMVVGFIRALKSPHQVVPDVSASSSRRHHRHARELANERPSCEDCPSDSAEAPSCSQLIEYSVRKMRSLTFTIVSIVFMNFIAYPMGVTVISYYKMSTTKMDIETKRMFFAIINLLHISSASINFFFYYFFNRSFRKMLSHCLCDNSLVGYQSASKDPMKPPAYPVGDSVRRASNRESIPNAHITGGLQKCDTGKQAFVYVVRVEDNSQNNEKTQKEESTDDDTSSAPSVLKTS